MAQATEQQLVGGRVDFVIANSGERIGDEHPYARELDASLRAADVPVVLYRVP